MSQAISMLTLVILGWGVASLPAQQLGDITQHLERQTISQLEQQLAIIDKQLSGLAPFSLRSGIGSIGYRSQEHEDAAHSEWIEISLDQKYSVDEVVLVPCVLRDAETGFTSDGFPLEFQVVVGVGNEGEERMVASMKASDQLLPRVAPVIVNCEGGVKADWVRIKATTLSPRKFDGKFLMQFAEVLVFSGQDNVALGQPVTCSSNVKRGSSAWDASFVVDGFMPYLMNIADENGSLAYIGISRIDKPSLSIDLGVSQPLSQVTLHLIDQSDTVPQAHTGDFGVPKLLQIEGANRADFSDAKLLYELHHDSDFDIGPIIMRRFPETSCRHVRITAIDPFTLPSKNTPWPRIGFAEIELIAGGKNVAFGKNFLANLKSNAPFRELDKLTDGKNFYGRILPTRQWLTQLASRHGLQELRPSVDAELNRRYLQQSINLQRMVWLAALLAIGTFVAVTTSWSLRQRAVLRTRERIAADLHDELGANFHAIGLLSDLAQANYKNPEKLRPLMQRMRELTERTGTAARHCANMLEFERLCDDLERNMRVSSDRILADLEREIVFEGEEFLAKLQPQRRIDLLLFYKECLTNVIRHSGATRVTTRLTADSKSVMLTIVDNGHGLEKSSDSRTPASLLRRAKLLHGRVAVSQPEDGGVCVELIVRLSKFRIFP